MAHSDFRKRRCSNILLYKEATNEDASCFSTLHTFHFLEKLLGDAWSSSLTWHPPPACQPLTIVAPSDNSYAGTRAVIKGRSGGGGERGVGAFLAKTPSLNLLPFLKISVSCTRREAPEENF